MPGRDDAARVHPETRDEWRAWLEAHHAEASGVWLVSWKQHTGRPAVGYDAAVEEALCFGWVDSTGRRLDEDRTMLWFARRKPRSGWSRVNKDRVARLEREGRLRPAGIATIERARADGSWSLLDDVEDLVVPADLAAAFARHPGSAEQFGAFPRSARRAILEWIVQARTPPTRERRLEETARLAAQGRRANEWRPREQR